MDTELLTRMKHADIAREVAHLRLVAAAQRDGERRPDSDRRPRKTAPAFAWRLLRALRPAS